MLPFFSNVYRVGTWSPGQAHPKWPVPTCGEQLGHLGLTHPSGLVRGLRQSKHAHGKGLRVNATLVFFLLMHCPMIGGLQSNSGLRT